MFKFLTSALSEADGSPSTVRLVAAISALAVLTVWCVTSVQAHGLAPISAEQLTLALAPLGFKVLQKSKEAPAVPATPAVA